MAKRKKGKKGKKPAKTPASAIVLLAAGVLIAVGGFGSGEALGLSAGVSVIVTGVTLVVGIVLAMMGLKRLRPVPKKVPRSRK